MTDHPGVLRQFPRSFWAANTMEIFERMGWYGFYAVSALYLTGSVEDGGLGFSSADRGVIQGIATFFIPFRQPEGEDFAAHPSELFWGRRFAGEDLPDHDGLAIIKKERFLDVPPVLHGA